MSLSKIAKRIVNPTFKVLNDAGFLDDTLEITKEGRRAAWQIIFAEYEEELLAAANDKIAEEKAAEKSTK